ncbi:MAG: class I SAM-dependent methyltransferase [Oscillatoria sp. PMC 1068.18]|nr:class I SAM-dependent methyltransferase [Oscillatoria sp. PMC 1076.18]MEC4990142.1 class I SAM-dependent methyltransferase [Oscillatoria sp. PMC 1068.18]
MPAMDYAKIADLYDTYVVTDLDVPFFINETRKATNVLELMSGTGRLSIPLLEAGVSLTCVDSSPEMLAIFRQKLEEKKLAATVREMDVCNLDFSQSFDLIILPFNSFSEIVNPDEQRQALRSIYNSLAENGRFICTLHNPEIRLRSINGQLTLRGKYSLANNEKTLFLWSIEQYNFDNHLVTGTQFYEVYDNQQMMGYKTFVDIQFYLHQQQEFAKLLHSEGFSVVNLYGDYAYSEFQAELSPFMIWNLAKNGRKL